MAQGCAGVLLLIGSFLSAPVQAQGLYKCEQADGRTSFQQQPCASGSQQAQLKQAPSAAASKSKAPAATPSPENAADVSRQPQQPSACAAAGSAIFDELGQHGQQPHAAMLRCQRNLKAQQLNERDSDCVQACMNTWVTDYKTKFKPPAN